MRLADVEAIFRALNAVDAKYLLVGLAVVAHGYVRYTRDVDIVLHLERDNVLRAMKSLESIGYHPLAPFSAADFADKDKRKSWITEKGMLVFQMRSSDPKGTDLDLFVEEPFSFADEYARALWEDIAGVRVPVICYEELLRLKRDSGRANDLGDIEQLELLKNPPNE